MDTQQAATDNNSLQTTTDNYSLQTMTDNCSLQAATDNYSLQAATDNYSLQAMTDNHSLQAMTDNHSLQATTYNNSLVGPGTKHDLFTWHGSEILVVILMMLIGILGNSIVLYITHCRWKRAIFTFFIKTLAWLDMSNLVFGLPMVLITVIHSGTQISVSACKGTTFVALFTSNTSAIVLVIIAFNRYRKICQANKSQVTLSLAKKLTLASALYGIAVSLPSVWMFSEQTMPYKGDTGPVNITYCFIRLDVDSSLLLTWTGVLGLTFNTVTVSLVILYGFTIRALRRHDKRRQSMDRRPSTVSETTKKVATKHTWVFIAVTVVFFVAYFPYFITVILLIADRSIESTIGPVAKGFFDLAKMFPLLSNVANPVIYSFTSERFRQECRKVFRLRPCMDLFSVSQAPSSLRQSRSETETET